MSAQKKEEICSIYEAAYLTKLSPELLEWLTKYSPKHSLSDKLKYHSKKEEIYFFKLKELLSFNDWLKKPWPKPENASRPSIPTAIIREIKNEANAACAMCHGYHNTCEAAHIDPVHESSNNHPDNLIWLCSNHHTAYDKGLYGPREQDKEFIVSYKKSLQHFKSMMWATQNKISTKLLNVLEDCVKLHEQLKPEITPEQKDAIEKIAKETLENLPNLTPVLESDPKYQAYVELEKNIKEISRDSQSSLKERLEKTKIIKDEYIDVYGYVICPLCKGERRHNGEDCPVCHAEGELEKRYADEVDLREYALVTCPLCDGERRHNGEDCPVCHGEGELEKRYAVEIDLREYDVVDCPVCKGKARYNGDYCRACNGAGGLEQRYADQIDLAAYALVTCPLCKGDRRHNGKDCHVCYAEGKLEKRYADEIDLSQYLLVDCPLCDGERRYRDEDCPMCDGDGKVEKGYADETDLSQYSLVPCPLCNEKGRHRGEDCPVCYGDGKIEKGYADEVDLGQYSLVSCPLCKGRGQRRGDDCRACDGSGEVEKRYRD